MYTGKLIFSQVMEHLPLHAQKEKFYHIGVRALISHNTLANANKVRDWHIYADLAQSLIPTARKLYLTDGFALELENTIYALYNFIGLVRDHL